MSILCSMVGASFTVVATALVGRTQRTVTAVGNAQISTAQSKFGGASALFDGTGDYLLSPMGSQWDFGTGSFTIEYFIRFNAINTLYVPVALRASGAINNGEWWCEITAAENKMYWGFKNYAGTTYYVNLALAGTAFATGQWYHIALVNNAGTAQMYVNGTATGATSALSGSFGISTTDLWVGAGAGAYSVNGYMDEVRISNTARYTANFTPSTTAFVNDANTLLLIHADGTDASTIFTDDASVIITPAASSVNEGSSLTFNVTTVGGTDQTLFYTLTNAGDFATSSGSFGLASNAGSFSVIPTADSTTEGAETFTASVRTESTSGPIIATSSAVTINDTSVPSVPAVAFDGTGDYYEGTVASSSGVADSLYTTIAGLVFKTTGGSYTAMNLIQVQLGTASGNPGFNVGHWDDGGILTTQADNSGSDNATVFGTSGSYGSWMQFVQYIDWSNFANSKYYVNGVDQTANFLNGPAFGERGTDGQAMNWTSSTTVKINIGSFFTYAGARDLIDYNGKIQYLLVKAGAGAPTISNYWDSATGKPKDLGTNGNATGLAPHIYHYGNTSTFGVNNASAKFATYTLTKFGGASDTSGTPYA